MKDNEFSIMNTPKIQKLSSQYFENSFGSDDSFVEDDIEKDPDWTQTPLYNRIRKLLV